MEYSRAVWQRQSGAREERLTLTRVRGEDEQTVEGMSVCSLTLRVRLGLTGPKHRDSY